MKQTETKTQNKNKIVNNNKIHTPQNRSRANHSDRVRAENTENISPDTALCWGRNAVIALLEGERGASCAVSYASKVFISATIQPHIKAKLTELCKKNNVVFQITDNAALDRMTEGENHQGTAAYTSPVEMIELEDFIECVRSDYEAQEACMVVICDRLQDPHNLGAIIRSAEAAGASGVLLPKRGGCLPTGTVVKTSAGAALRLPIVKIGNVSQAIKRLQEEGFWVTGLAMEGRDTLFKEDLPKRSAIVVGAEGDGLGQTVIKACDDIRFIPMCGATGSLNASVAAAIAMFEWTRSVTRGA